MNPSNIVPMTHSTLIFISLMAITLQVHAKPSGAQAILNISKLPQQGETLVWSPLFQASWDKMNSLHEGKPEKVEPPNPLITSLNQFQWNMDEVMPKDGYAVFAGPSTSEFAKATADQIKQQFGIDMTPSRLPTNPRGHAIYGVLLRNLNFQKPFFRSRKKPLEFKDSHDDSHHVSFFGTVGSHSDNFGKHVKVLSYKNQGKSFTLSIATDHKDEKLIIYRPEQALSFQTAIDRVHTAIQAPLTGPYGSVNDGNLHNKDTVKIPYLTLKSDTDFTTQLQGNRYYTDNPMPWTISMAYQITHFELFEKGARIRVETAIGDAPFGGPPPPRKVLYYVPRHFICDRPFFVFAWKDKSPIPYFAAWIDGKGALQPFSR